MAQFASLLPPSWQSKVTEWIHEDIPSFDYGGFVVGTQLEKAVLWGKAKVHLNSFFAFRPPHCSNLLSLSLSLSVAHTSRESWLESRLWMRSFAS